jgi:toxin ParE1/3/4
MSVILRISAEKDIREIYDWYESQRKGLGNEFLDEFEKILPYLETIPGSFRVRYKRFRIVSISRFPYLIYFRIQNESIIIQKIGHDRRSKRKLKL